MTVCPCCGSKLEADLQREGCSECGARAVGPPLSRPVRELPYYGRSLLVGALGGLLLVAFLAYTLAALFGQTTVSFRFWSLVSAAETAAWQLKWVALPAAVIVAWAGSALTAGIRRNPGRFAGGRIARAGVASAALVAVMITTFIGVTIPERIRQGSRGHDAAFYAQGYTIQRALLEYRSRFGTLPATLDELKVLPDADGSIAEALRGVDSSAYSPGADLAALPKKKAPSLRGSALRNASLRSTDDQHVGGLSFNRYELRLPGRDKKLGTEDDWTVRDGLISKPVVPEERATAVAGAAAEAAARKP